MPSKYKKRKDGRYLMQIQIGLQDSGKPKYKNVYAYTIKELEEKAAIFRQELDKGIVVNSNNLTVATWSIKWLEVYKSSREYKTIQMYDIVIRNHIIPELGHYKLKDLKSYHIQELINKKHNQGLTKTLSVIKLTLKQILNQAIKNEYIYKNVASDISLPNVNKIKKRSLTEEEKQYIIKANWDLKSKVFVYILLHTGLRRGEALALTKTDIDLKNKSISVNKTLIFQNNKGVIKPTPKSEAGNRIIPIPDILLNDLVKYISNVNCLYIFPTSKNTLMTETTFRRFWIKIKNYINESAGGRNQKPKLMVIANDITPHIFRHTYATTLYYAGIDIKTTQYLLGHSSIQMTMDIYTHLDSQTNNSAREKLNLFLTSQKTTKISTQ